MATDLLIVIAAGFCGGVLARLLRQPLVLGYLVAGIAVGPHTGGISVGDPANLERLAEIGATLLLFGLGLELSLKALAPVRRVALFGTPIQVALTMAVAWPVGAWLGLRWTETVWLGALVSLSSTLVVLKALQSQGRIGTLSSRVMLGMLVAQDLAFIPLMIVLPRLGGADAGTADALVAILKAAVLIAALLTLGARLLPRLVEWVARSGSRELFLLVTMGIALGIAFVTHQFGVSSAVGAFVAGLVLSESDYSHQALSDIIPLRDVFSLLFFASIGMLLDPTQVLGQWRSIVVVVGVISVCKGLIFAGVTRAFGYRNVVPLASALGLFGIGEFSFVLARTGFAAGAISASLYALVLNTAVITMVLTPVVSGLTTPIYGWVSRRRTQEPVQTINFPDTALAGHIIVAGAGRLGCRIADVLQGLNLPFIVIELDHRRIDVAKTRGFPTVFGDAAQAVVLEAAGIGRARLLMVTTPALGVSRAVVEHARRINPSVNVVVRAESADAMRAFRAMGVARSRAAGTRGEPGDDPAGPRAPSHVPLGHRAPDRQAARGSARRGVRVDPRGTRGRLPPSARLTFDRIAPLDPVGPEAVRQDQHPQLRESQALQRRVRRAEVGAVPHRAAPAVNDEAGRSRQRLRPRRQVGEALQIGCRAVEHGARYVGRSVEKLRRRAHDDRRARADAAGELLDEVRRHDRVRAPRLSGGRCTGRLAGAGGRHQGECGRHGDRREFRPPPGREGPLQILSSAGRHDTPKSHHTKPASGRGQHPRHLNGPPSALTPPVAGVLIPALILTVA